MIVCPFRLMNYAAINILKKGEMDKVYTVCLYCYGNASKYWEMELDDILSDRGHRFTKKGIKGSRYGILIK